MKKFAGLLIVLILHFNIFIDRAYADNEADIPSPGILNLSTNQDSLLNNYLSKSWQLRNSNPDLSLENSLKAIKLATELKDYENLTKAHSFAGVAYRLLGDYNQALDMFFVGLAMAEEHNIPQQEGYARINIANLYIYLEYFSVALENLDNALPIAQRIDDEEMLSYIYLNRGRALMPSGRYEEARESISNALKIRIETGNKPGQAVCYKYIGDIDFDDNKFNNALENYLKALAVVDEKADRHLVGNIYLKMAQINSQKDLLSEASEYAQKALSIGEEVNSRLIIHDALKVLSKVDFKKKDYESAAIRLQKMLAYADTLFNQRLAEKVLNTEFQWERQKKQAEIDLLNKDKEIQRLRISRQKVLNYALIGFSILILFGLLILSVLLKKIQNKNNILIRQKEELDHINKAKDKMFMVIGHDLRGPIWTLKALIEIIREEEEILFQNSNLTENFNALTKSVQAVSDLLENLLYWARAEDGKLVFSPKQLQLNTLISQSLQSYKPWALLKNLSIINEVDKHYMVFADENMLKAIIRNLLSNAIKFSHNDGIVKITATQANGSHEISIEDNGIGISPEMVQTILSKDIFLSTKGTGNEIGSGIGLNICKEFVEMHGGKIWAENKPDKGSVFHFTLPEPDTEKQNGG